MLKSIKENKIFQLRLGQGGVTLLEMLVAVSIFSVVMLSATAIFKFVIEGQRNAIAAQNIQESMRYVLEVIAKEVRMAQKDRTGACVGTANKVYATSNDQLFFRNVSGQCVIYFLDNDVLKINRNGQIASSTPASVKASNLKFIVSDNVGAIQSSVTMRMDVETTGKKMHKQSMAIQTTISSRYYE